MSCCLALVGGHPHNWTAISRECLNLLNDMTQKLVLYQEAAATNGRVMSTSYTAESKKPNSLGNLFSMFLQITLTFLKRD